MNIAHIIIRPLTTEKASMLQGTKTYSFLVARQANKNQIAQAIKEVYGAKVLDVHTVTRSGKTVRVGKTRTEVTTMPSKVAYVRVAEALNVITHG